MDKKSKVLLFIFFIALAISIVMTYKRTMIDRDFEVIDTQAQTGSN